MALYYVRTDGHNTASGLNNTNNLTTGAWATLEYASTHVTSGDIIHIVAGLHTIVSTVVLPLGVSLIGDGVTSIVTSILSGPYQKILDLESVTEGTNGNQSISYLNFNGDSLTTSWCISVAARSNVSIHHCEFHDFKDTAVNFSGISSPLGAGMTPPTVYATGNSFHDNIIYNCASNSAVTIVEPKYGKGGLQFGGQDGFECYNNDIQQPQRISPINEDIGWPIKMANRGHIKNCKVYNNTLKRAAMAADNGGNQNWNFCFEMWYIHGGFEFYDNICQGEVDLANLYKESAAFGMKFYGNTCMQPSISNFLATGLRMETDIQYVEIYDNTFYNINTALSFSPFDYGDGIGLFVNDINIHHNLMYNIGKTSGSDKAVMMDNTSVNPQCYFHNFYFDNNTVIAASGVQAPFYGIEVPNYAGGNTHDMYIRNNHFQGFSQHPIIIGNGANVYNVFIQNNNYYGNGTNGVIIFSGGTPVNYTNTGNITLSPNLNGSYHPNLGSPLIDTGLNIGYTYSGSAPDIGFFETGGSGNISPNVNAGVNQTITLPTNSTTLIGTANDPDGTIVSILWTRVSGPNTPVIVSPSNLSTSVAGLITGIYIFQLQVTDNLGTSSTDTIQITVNSAPISSLSIKRKITILT